MLIIPVSSFLKMVMRRIVLYRAAQNRNFPGKIKYNYWRQEHADELCFVGSRGRDSGHDMSPPRALRNRCCTTVRAEIRIIV